MIAQITGMINMIRRVVFGLIPAFVNPAYAIDPTNPAPPVPDDHADMTFVSNLAAKDKNVTSPKPLERDAKTMPG